MYSTMQDVPLSIGNIVRHGTTAYADRAVISYDGEVTRHSTFGEVGARAARLAHALRDRFGVGIGEPVGSFSWNTTEHLECYMAVPGMGAVLHTINVRYTPDQLVKIVRSVGERVLFVDQSLLGVLEPVLPLLDCVEHVVVMGAAPDTVHLAAFAGEVHDYEQLIADRPEAFDWVELPETSAALMCFTTGTTGDPKGVVYSHRSVCLTAMQLCMGDYSGITPGDRILLVVPMFHVNAWNLPFAALLVGASLVLPGRHVQAEHLVTLIETCRPTMTNGVPTIWSGIYAEAEARDADLSSLRMGQTGGTPFPRRLMQNFERQFGVPIIQGWGMTEMSPIATVARPDGIDDPEEAWEHRFTQGRLLSHVQARICDSEGNVLPNDGATVGEIETRGPWVTGSYFGGVSESSFHDGWLRTGDLGTISPDRVVRLTDRTKDVIKSGGEWISSLAIEEIVQSHDAVIAVAVVGAPDETWGERPLAAVELSRPVDAAELAAHVMARLPRWQVPDHWVLMDSLPRTSVGKPDKAELRQRLVRGQLPTETINTRAIRVVR